MTPAEARVLAVVREIGSDGWPVTVREVQAKLGYGSTSTAHKHLEALEWEGLVERNPRWPSGRGGWRVKPSHDDRAGV